ncbi:sulfotransferase family protein [Novosphingobium album (ex Liu et al. 2023)]|uniref:Sulfotransferase n=1 Tax=Novosphingobium album (ex Liu et al. 2023) TaxID=3031130 RepID=A0ABT5WQU1_9SPHN|nr:sulfotransferase [Novosphingobium album (ex Liu et al. 2023)]MDE8652404.1 sulfotransferase [Novosphingobium album (ex Liu et al. 2023)]
METRYDPPERFAAALDQAHEAVIAEIGTDDFGPRDYLPGLQALLQSMDYDPHFHEQGRRLAWGMVVGVLRGRAQAIAAMKANPGFDARAIESPVVIIGVPRTGTTALHRLMAVDPRFQGLQTWLLDSPRPRPPVEDWASDPDFQRTVAQLKAQHTASPDHKAAHFRAAEEVHECCMVLRHGFVSNLWSCGWSAPTYDAWWQSTSEAAAYDYYYRCVQLIGANEPDKRWLLKNPGHVENLDLLFAVYPDAKVIQTHRDPARAVPSLVSLLMLMHPLMEEGRAGERGAIMLRREVAKWSSAVRKCDAVRARHPGKVLDVVHGDFHRQPMQVLDRIYRFIGMDIPEATRDAFARRIAEKPELAHGVHRYRIEDYGMTADEAREPFGDYIQRYDLVETKA